MNYLTSLMNYLTSLKVLTLSGAMALAFTAWGVPAKPGIRTAIQPDGSVISYRVVGDERAHYDISVDGCLLVRDDSDNFFFAEITADGRLESTGIKASDIAARPARAARAADLGRLARQAAPRKNAARVPSDMLTTTFPSTGTPRALVVLVEYTDVKFTHPDPKAHFEALLNRPGYSEQGAVGSARDYFSACSMGKFIPQFDVYGPLTLSNRQSYYGRNNSNGDDTAPHEMAVEACEQLDDEIDFNVYDTDGDGLIDNVYVFYAGKGEANGGSKSTVWPHSWDMSEGGVYTYFDGVRLDHYACSNELYDSDEFGRNTYEGIGTFCHEFSHVLGLPDLYCTGGTMYSPYTPGSWNILDEGSYNADGHVPPYYSAFERLSMGWIEPQGLTGPDDVELEPISKNKAYIINTDRDNEFFLLENRQLESYDTHLPGHGMLIWHIDYDEEKWASNTVNNTYSRQCVDIEEADNSQSYYKSARDGETFPGYYNKTSFTDDTKPGMKTWSGKRLGLPLTDITETPEGLITFKVAGGKAASIADVTAGRGSFTLEGRDVLAAEGEAAVYNMAGALIGRGARVHLPAPGIYLVESAGTHAKVSVR